MKGDCFYISVLLKSPHNQLYTKGCHKKNLQTFHPFKPVTITTNSPQVLPKGYHQKYLQKFHPFYSVTVTTNSPQVLSRGYHQKFLQKFHPFYSLTVSTNSPQVLPKSYHQKNFTLSTLFLSPLIHLKCCQKAVTKKLQKFHPFYIVTVTTNSPQPLPLLHHYFIHKYHPFSSLSVTHSHSYTSLTIKISHH